MYIRYKSSFYEIEDVSGDGLCLFHSLATTMDAPGEGTILRRTLAAVLSPTDPQYLALVTCFTSFVKSLRDAPEKTLSAMAFLHDMKRELTVSTITKNEWGTDNHMLLHSLITGNRVVCYQPTIQGLTVAFDSDQAWDNIVEWHKVNKRPVPSFTAAKTHKVQYILFHKQGQPDCTNTVDQDHYAGLKFAFSSTTDDGLDRFFFSSEDQFGYPNKGKECKGTENKTCPILKRKRGYDLSRPEDGAPGGRFQRLRNETARKQVSSQRQNKDHTVDINVDVNWETRLAHQHWFKVCFEPEPLNHNYLREDMNASNAEKFDIDVENMTPGELAQFLDEDKAGALQFNDVMRSPSKAVLLHYLNSGLFAFQRWKEYRDEFAGNQMSEDEKAGLIEEILEEMLTDEELVTLLQRFFKCHNYNEQRLPSCGTCGIREWERPEAPKRVFQRIVLGHTESDLLKYGPAEEVELSKFRNVVGSSLCIPISEDKTRVVDVWRAKSVYEAKDGKHWHVHPELVDVDPMTGSESTLVCPHCHDKLVKGCTPDYSIASGLDFGFYKRLGLTLPNLHEQLMLSRTRMFFAAVKCTSNVKGQVNFNVKNRLKCHAILFPSREAETIPYMMNSDVFGDGGLLDMDYLKCLLSIFCVDDKLKPDELMNFVRGSNELFGRPYVVAQWILVLSKLNRYYRDIEVDDGMFLTRVQEQTFMAVNMVKNGIKVVDDPMAMAHETHLGGDVAETQQAEKCDDNKRARRSSPCSDTNPQSMRYSYVTSTEQGHYADSKHDGRLSAVKRLIETNSEEECRIVENIGLVDRTFIGAKDVICSGNSDRDCGSTIEGSLTDGSKNAGNEIIDSEGAVHRRTKEEGLSDRPVLCPQDSQISSFATFVNAGDCGSVTSDDRYMDWTGTPTWDSFDVSDDRTFIKEQSRRDAEPVNDFGDDVDHEQNMSTTFPHVFLLGNSYTRHPGRLSHKMRYHLLHQFTNAPSTDRRLLAYLFDHKQRIAVMDGVKAYVNGSRTSLDAIEELLGDPKKRSELQTACDNPSGEGNWKILKEYIPHLQFASNDVPYGASGGKKFKWRATEMNKRYTCPNCFLTISPTNLDNPRSIRLAFRARDNSSFPAVFEPGCAYGESPEDFAYRLRQNTTLVSEGNIELPKGVLSRSSRADLAMNNPVAFVQENKTLLYDILSLLIGFNIEDSAYYSKTEGESTRATKYYKAKKGIFGHPLYAIGVTEDHHRGTLHWHISLLAGVPPYVLQRFANLKDVGTSISRVLDSMYTSDVPEEAHVGYFLRDALERRVRDPVWKIDQQLLASISSPEPLLFVADRESHIDQLCRKLKKERNIPRRRGVFGKIFHLVATLYGSYRQYHRHGSSCHKTHKGHLGCRFDFPCGLCETTRGVCLSPNVAQSDGTTDNRNSAGNGLQPEVEASTDPGQQTWKEHDIRSYIVRELDIVKDYVFIGQDPLSISCSDSLIVWENKKPTIVPSLEKQREGSDGIRGMKDVLLKSLKELPDLQSPHGDRLHRWIITKATDKQIKELWDEIIERLPEANRMVPAFNPVLSYCTGSHNHASLLGAIDQAKSALFYLVPYQGKSKFPIKEALPILNNCLQHVDRNPSKHPNESGMKQRTIKHLLTRTLNRMHLRMEISDYEMAAALLDLPSVISTERFSVGNPKALAAFTAEMARKSENKTGHQAFMEVVEQMKEKYKQQRKKETATGLSFGVPVWPDSHDQEEKSPTTTEAVPTKNETDDIQTDFGFIRPIQISGEKTVAGEPTTSTILVPEVALYLQRSKDLKSFSYYEYLACVGVRKGEAKIGRKQERFPLEPTFHGSTDVYHVLEKKQKTPLLIGTQPPHPGKMPVADSTEDDNRISLYEWRIRADRYARYFLTLFRPFHVSDQKLSFTWTALEEWIQVLKMNSDIRSTFRLMMLHQHVKGLRTLNICKTMAREYRARNRRHWDAWEVFEHKERERRRRDITEGNPEMDQYDLGATTELGTAVNNNMKMQMDHGIKTEYQMNNFFRNVTPGKFKSRKSGSGVPYRLYTHSENDTIEAIREFKLTGAKPYDSDKFWKNTNNQTKAKKDIERLRKQLVIEQDGQIKNRQQLELFDLYSKHFLRDPEAPTPPFMLLCHGGPGVGKSVIRSFIDSAAKACGRCCFKTSFNAINAIEMGGDTTSAALRLDPKTHHNHVGTFKIDSNKSIDKVGDLKMAGFDSSSLVIVEEVSNQSPWHLARLDFLCKMAADDHTRPFGGAFVLFIGDLTQLGPVKAIPLSCGAMDITMKKELRTRLGTKQMEALGRTHLEKGDRPELERYAFDHPHTIGSKLITHPNLRWFELTEQRRSKDPLHTKFVTGNYRGQTIDVEDILTRYKLFSEKDAANLEWIKAPMLVSTNRERQSLTHTRCLQYALATGKVVVRWRTKFNWSSWEQKPLLHKHRLEALKDPCFYEYFVDGADAFLTENIQKHLKLTNATSAKYHSLLLDPTMKTFLAREVLAGKTLVTLPAPPDAINMEIKVDERIASDEVIDFLEKHQTGQVKYSTEVNRHKVFVLPIWQYTCKKDSAKTTVRGSAAFQPSKVILQKVFPIEPAFAITVHKSEGRTMPKVIIALSRSMARGCDFSYAQVHVAFSRVEDSNNIRLLLTGSHAGEQNQSIVYLTKLRPKPSINYYFGGFRRWNYEEPNVKWETNEWNKERANQSYEEYLKATGQFKEKRSKRRTTRPQNRKNGI